MQQRGVQVVDMDLVLNGVPTELIGSAVDNADLDAGAFTASGLSAGVSARTSSASRPAKPSMPKPLANCRSIWRRLIAQVGSLIVSPRS
jgi:hypothetical protein